MYFSDLTDKEWEILEPLLLQILPKKKRTRPSNWTKREILNGILYQLKNGCNWCDLPKDFPPYSTVYWHYKQWRAAGVLETLMHTLHGQAREQVKKSRSGQRWSSLILKRWKILAMLVWIRRATVSTKQQMASKGISPLIPLGFPSLPIALLPMLQTMWGCLRCWCSTSTTLSRNQSIFPRSLSSLTTVIILTTWLRSWRRCIPRSGRKSGLSFQRNPPNRRRWRKENLDLSRLSLGGWLNDRMLGWSVVKAWWRTLSEHYLMQRPRSTSALLG